ncbi:YTX2-like protein, partial [Mya arenaria]
MAYRICPLNVNGIRDKIKHHNTIEIEINTENVARGPGLWMFNTRLLNDTEYVSPIKHNKTSYASCSEWWKLSKIKIRAITLEYSQLKNRSKTNIKKLEQTLSELLSEVLTPEIIEKISNIKQLIADYYDSNLEKQRGKNKLWHHIKTDSGTIKYGIDSILLNSEGTDSVSMGRLINKLPTKLSESDKDKLESNLNITELDNVIKTFKRGKSPGEDGMTAEWYQFFWDIIREDFLM